MSEMLDNPADNGLYSTTDAMDALEALIDQKRAETLGWMYAEACILLDKGQDLREVDVPSLSEKHHRDVTCTS